MIKVRCSMAMSPNGYIAKPDGDEDWLSAANWTEFMQDAKACNNFVVGRETFELVMRLYKDQNFDNIDCAHKLIVTTQANFQAPPAYTVVSSPAEAVKYLEAQGTSELLLAGGGKLNAAFAEAGLIDELELIIEPYVIGEGRQVLAPGNYEFPLELKQTEQLSGGRTRLLYAVKNKEGL